MEQATRGGTDKGLCSRSQGSVKCGTQGSWRLLSLCYSNCFHSCIICPPCGGL